MLFRSPHYDNVAAFIPEFRQMAEAAGRQVPVTIWGAKEDRAMLEADRALGVERVIVSFESAKADVILPQLDRWAGIIESLKA